MYIYSCSGVCKFSLRALREVSEEDLSGTRNDVCSSAAELGHRKVEKESGRQK